MDAHHALIRPAAAAAAVSLQCFLHSLTVLYMSSDTLQPSCHGTQSVAAIQLQSQNSADARRNIQAAEREREREIYKYSISQLARYDAVPECKITARDLACRLIHSRYTYSRYIGLLLYLYVIFLRIRHVPARDVTMTSSHGLLMQAISGAERPRSKLLQFSALRDCPGRLLLQHCNSVVKILPMNIPSDRTACVYTGRQKNR